MQAHYAVQWLARTARATIPPRPDDGHTNLGWDDGFDGFTTHRFSHGTALGLRIPDLTLVLFADGRITQSFPLHGHSEAEARAWLGRQMQQVPGLAPTALDAPLPYALPPHPLAEGGCYDATSIAAPLCELAAWYANACAALGTVMQRLAAHGWPAPEVRCWPHHFDLDCLTPIGNGDIGTPPSMGAGFSPGDQYYDEPYFYVSAYPRPAASALPCLPQLGHWHRKDFLAAVAPASRILALRDRQAETQAFLHAAADGIVKALSNGATARAN